MSLTQLRLPLVLHVAVAAMPAAEIAVEAVVAVAVRAAVAHAMIALVPNSIRR